MSAAIRRAALQEIARATRAEATGCQTEQARRMIRTERMSLTTAVQLSEAIFAADKRRDG